MIDRSAPPETPVHILRSAAEAAPDAEALVCGGARLNYRQYWAAVAGLAARLRDLTGGDESGRVATIMGASVEMAVAYHAVQAAGAQLVPLNPLYTEAELDVILEDAAPALSLIGEDASVSVRDAAARRCRLGSLTLIRDETLADAASPALAIDLPKGDAPALLQYTGGTSGRPKGVSLTGRAVAANVWQREAALPTRIGEERVLVVTPLYHSYASSMGLGLAAFAASALIVAERFDPEETLATITAERVTLFAGAPTVYNALLSAEGIGAADLSSLRLCYSGSAALPAETLRRWEAIAGCPICEGYGQTEAGPVLSFNPAEGERKSGSVGPALPLTEIEIVDVETGREVLPAGTRGEIRARGPQIMSGYRNRPEETAAALRSGWLHTGDIGELDEDGYLFIRDRKKDMVVTSGFNVYPREVEEALFALPGVADAAVVGRPDERRGEALVAFVVAAPGIGVGEAEAHLRGRLTAYKIPRTFRFVDALPKTAVGKTDKQALKRMAGDEG